MTPVDTVADVVKLLLVGVVLPVWMLAGLADWLCHRVQHIEATTGVPEVALHLLMLLQLGTAVVLALLLEPTALLIVLMALLLVLHEATQVLDLAYAQERRSIPAIEQWVHGVQHTMPWAGFAGWLALAPDQLSAVLGWPGHAAAVWHLQPRVESVPDGLVHLVLAGAAALNVLPFLEELARATRFNAARAARRWHRPPGATHGPM